MGVTEVGSQADILYGISGKKESGAQDSLAVTFSQLVQEQTEEFYVKLKTGTTEPSYQIGAGSYTQKQWSRLLKSFDAAQEALREAEFGDALERSESTCQGSKNLTLHIGKSEDGEEAIGAWSSAVDGSSVTVYVPKDFDEGHPVYRVKIWDPDGNVTERMVDIEKVDARNCDTIDMYAYACHLSHSGKYKDAQQRFMMAQAHHTDMYRNYTYANKFDKTDWLELVRGVMEMQYSAGNLAGYLDYRNFLEELEKEREQQEAETDSQIIVKPDGSKVLLATMEMAGMSTAMSIKISGPEEFVNGIGVSDLEV